MLNFFVRKKVEKMEKLTIDNMTLEQKIGHLIISRGFVNEEDKEFFLEMVDKRAVGGLQVRYYEGCEKLISEIKKRAGYPLLICADMEHGFPGSKLKIPSQMAISSTGDPKFAYEVAKVTAIEAKKSGYNVVWGPVVDLADEGMLCKISRCFGDDVDVVSEYAGEMVRAYQEEGMVCTAKHFPGGSDTFVDQHMEPGISNFSKEDLLNKDIRPYIDIANKIGLSGIMTCHTYFDKIDPVNMASMSKTVIDIIREQGFTGVIMTDSLAMMAIIQKYGEKECLIQAIAAGNDMVLPNYRLSFKESFDSLLEGYNKGIITEERLNEAVKRVLKAQELTLKEPSQTELNDYQKNIVEELNKKSLCSIVKDGVNLKLSSDTKKLIVLLCENEYPDVVDESHELERVNWYFKENVEIQKEEFKKIFPDAEFFILKEFPNQIEIENLCVAISKADEVIFRTFCRATSYISSDCLTERVKYIIKANKDKVSAVIHLGNPYELKNFKYIPRLFLGQTGGNNDFYALKALKGEFVPTGKIPVKL